MVDLLVGDKTDEVFTEYATEIPCQLEERAAKAKKCY